MSQTILDKMHLVESTMFDKGQEMRTYLLSFLQQTGSSTTNELIRNAPKKEDECFDKKRARVVAVLLALEDQKLISKEVSKEKRSIVWSLAQ
ncbi:MAG: hypothetical protein ACXACI_01585 [Candidatus Hodarchaeales archaeon]